MWRRRSDRGEPHPQMAGKRPVSAVVLLPAVQHIQRECHCSRTSTMRQEWSQVRWERRREPTSENQWRRPTSRMGLGQILVVGERDRQRDVYTREGKQSILCRHRRLNENRKVAARAAQQAPTFVSTRASQSLTRTELVNLKASDVRNNLGFEEMCAQSLSYDEKQSSGGGAHR